VSSVGLVWATDTSVDNGDLATNHIRLSPLDVEFVSLIRSMEKVGIY
jgi:hypothetical protein